jgi:hypothetical protein
VNGGRRAADMVQERGLKWVAGVQIGCKRGRFSAEKWPCEPLADQTKACVEALSEEPDGVRTLHYIAL